MADIAGGAISLVESHDWTQYATNQRNTDVKITAGLRRMAISSNGYTEIVANTDPNAVRDVP